MSGKLVIPVLASALVEAKAETVSWWATNIDLWRSGVLAADIATAGSGLLPVLQATAMIKACAEGQVRLVFSASGVKLIAGAFNARLPVQSVSEFPETPTLPTTMMTLPRGALLAMLRQILPVVSDNHTKHFMRGALFVIGDGAMTCVGTDGHQMAESVTAHVEAGTTPVDTILPKKCLIELAVLLADSDEADVIYSHENHQHVFRCGDDVLVSRTIDDRFPDYKRVMPTKGETRLICDREAFSSLLARVMLASDGRVPKVRLITSNGHITVTAKSAERGDAVEQIEVERIGPDISVQVNGAYLQNFLQTATSEKVACEIGGQRAPLLFQPVDQPGAAYRYVVQTMSDV